MEIEQLKKLLDEIFKNPKIEEFAHSIAGIMAYLKSEQDKRMELTKAMQDLKEDLYGAKNNEGLKHKLNAIETRSEKNGKLQIKIAFGIGVLVVAKIVDVVFSHVKFN